MTVHGLHHGKREVTLVVGSVGKALVQAHGLAACGGMLAARVNHPRVCGEQGLRAEDRTSDDSDSQVNVYQNLASGTISLPLVGRVAAGVPILAEQNVEEVLTLPTSIVGDSSTFMLRVRGTSMVNVGIYDGDYIVVKEQHDARDGEIIVALLDDSATVKTFYREADHVRLQPENDLMEPIYVKNPKILGRVTALIRAM